MNPQYHSRPGQRMARKSSGDGGRRRSRIAALGALLAVAVLAALAAGLIGHGSALADRGLAPAAWATGSSIRELAQPPSQPPALPQIPGDAEQAQPIATF